MTKQELLKLVQELPDDAVVFCPDLEYDSMDGPGYLTHRVEFNLNHIHGNSYWFEVP